MTCVIRFDIYRNGVDRNRPQPGVRLRVAANRPLGEDDVDVDGDRHQITSFSSACICAASASRASSGGAPAAL
jgi:hypothetical protein